MLHYRGTTRLCALGRTLIRLQQALAGITAANPWRPTGKPLSLGRPAPAPAAVPLHPGSHQPPVLCVDPRNSITPSTHFTDVLSSIIACPVGGCQEDVMAFCPVFHSFHKVFHGITAVFAVLYEPIPPLPPLPLQKMRKKTARRFFQLDRRRVERVLLNRIIVGG